MSLVILYILVTLPALGGRALAVRLLGFSESEGWALGRTVGLVLVAFPAWWAGVAGLAGWQWIGAAVLLGSAVVGILDLRRHPPDRRSLAGTEFVFVLGAASVMWLRLVRPEILGQEKLMDLGIMATLLRADSFPPPDMWLAGETLPYYYWGALIWTVPLELSKVPLDLAYNLVVAGVGGLSACLFWALGRRAGGNVASGWIAVGFGLFAGTADGFRQFMATGSIFRFDYWHSSRQVPDTITEWPLFTLWLGDLHPHLLSIPLALATLLLAWQIGRSGPRIALVLATSVLFGVTWAANPWSMPPTLVAAALMILCGDGSWHWPNAGGRSRWIAVAVVAVAGWLAAAPFHLSFHPPFQGVEMVAAWTEPAMLLLWGGVLLIPVVAAGWALMRGFFGGDARAHAIAVTVLAATLVVASVTGRPTLVMLAGLLAVLVVAAVTGERGTSRPGIALAALGVFLLLVPEVVYVVDSYGEKLHRMNTVFKCYIQAWVFLAVALPALLDTGFRRRQMRSIAVLLMCVLALPHLLGMAIQPVTGTTVRIDGLAWMDPGDRSIVRFLRTQPRGTSIAEAVGGAYTEYARISSASGVPSFLGWANHELVWRGHDVSALTDARGALIDTIYRSGSPRSIKTAVDEAGIDLVVIGALERRDFDAAHLDAIRIAGEEIPLEDGGVVVRFRGSELPGE